MSNRKSQILIVILVFFLSVGLGIGCSYLIFLIRNNIQDKNFSSWSPTYEYEETDMVHTFPNAPENPSNIVIDIVDSLVKEPIGRICSSEPQIINVEHPIYDQSSRNFSLHVDAHAESGDALYYELHLGPEIKYVSADGNFEGIQASPSGKYKLVVRNITTEEDVSLDVKGFLPPLSKSELSRRLSKPNPDRGLAVYFPSGYRLRFTNIKSDEPAPTSYTYIYSYISSGYWRNVEVISMQTNDDNEITSLEVKVYYNE